MATASSIEIKRAAEQAQAAAELKAIREQLARIEKMLGDLLKTSKEKPSKMEAAWVTSQARITK